MIQKSIFENVEKHQKEMGNLQSKAGYGVRPTYSGNYGGHCWKSTSLEAPGRLKTCPGVKTSFRVNTSFSKNAPHRRAWGKRNRQVNILPVKLKQKL